MEARKQGSKTAHAWLTRSHTGDVPNMRAACGLVVETALLSKDLTGTRQCGRCAEYLDPRVPGVRY